MKDISIVIPVYNDGEALEETLNSVFEVAKKLADLSFEIIVVNDCSTDNTAAILSKHNNILVITNPYNLGYGASLKRGIKIARGEWIFITDADGTYPIERLVDFVPSMAKFDMIVGSRTTDHNQTPFLRRPAKKFLNWFASYLAGIHIPDLNSGMRLFKRELCLEFWNLYPRRFSFTSTITMSFIKSNYFIKYIPIDYFKRVGKSSIVPSDFFGFLSLVFRIAFYFEPLKFLLPISGLSFAIGLIKGGFDLYRQNFVGNLSIFMLVSSVLIMVLALLADLVSKQRK
jgi:glycosyltransferase involved in cell wall biosynthesis